jgi:hypothetical protein
MKVAHVVLGLGWLGACSSGGLKIDGPSTQTHDGATDQATGEAPGEASAEGPQGGAAGAAGTVGAGPGDAAADQAPSDAPGGEVRPDGATDGTPGQVVTEISSTVNRDIDILFMIDNSLSMQPLQSKLTTNFPVFINVLKGLPGGLPNLHLAVVSSDMGAGRVNSVDIPSCRHGGDQGIFRSTPRGMCATTGLDAGQNFISNINGQANYTGDISQVFSCIASVGDGGCGFEHQFASVLRALGADGRGAAPPENASFLRPNAYLAVILLTNEDDCSAPADSDLFDPASRLVSDPLGPLASYRCNEFGHLCGGQRPPRSPAGPVDLSGTCQSAEDGRLFKVADVVAALKVLKPDPSQILVAAIAGDTSPYVVKLGPPSLKEDPNQWPYIEHSCTTATDYADPAIRVKEWVDAFHGNGVFQSICNDSFAPALQRIAQVVGGPLGAPCIPAKIVGGTAHPACTAVDHTFSAQGMTIDTPLPACTDNNAQPPCWALTTDALRCGVGNLVTLQRAPGPYAPLSTTVTCQVCQANDTRPGCQ